MMRLAILGLAMFAVSAWAQDKPKLDVKHWRLSTALGPAYPQGKAGELWAQLITERSAGHYVVKHFPGAALAQRDPAREFGALRDGAMQLAVGSASYWSMQVKELNVFALPWLIADHDALDALLASVVAARLSVRIEAAGVVPLAWAGNVFLELATRQPVHAPSDLAGWRIRAQSLPLLMDTLAVLGAAPTAMTITDAQVALTSGVLDGEETTVAAYAAARLHTAGLKHLQLWGAHADALVFGVNAAVWKSLSAADQDLVRQAAHEAAMGANAFARALTADTRLAKLGRDGANVTSLTPSGKELFRAAARPVYEKWAAVVGEDLVREAEGVVRSQKSEDRGQKSEESDRGLENK